MQRYKHIFMMILFAVLLYNDAQASPPTPKSKVKALKTFEARLETEKEIQKHLEKQSDELQKNLNNTKKNLISVAQDIQKNEQEIKNIEQRIINFELKKSVLDDKLLDDRASISRLVLALTRIRKTPPEAMLASPDTPYKTAQSAMLMGSILPSINRHAEKLTKNLETLETVTEDLKSEQDNLKGISKSFSKKHKTLNALMAQRTDLYSKTNKDLKAHEITIEQISLHAKDLQDLVTKIEEQQRQEAERKATANILRKKPARAVQDDGVARLPISGIVRTSYHQKDEFGAKSKGITIEGRAKALITAPMNGKVQFTGSFKRYGKIVIIEHPNNYHSLIAGLDVIQINVGDIVKSGEPIGLLPNTSLIPRPKLYYELRKNGIAINPAKKISDLG